MIQILYFFLGFITILILGTIFLFACRYSFCCANLIYSCFNSYFIFDRVEQTTSHLDNLNNQRVETKEEVKYKPGFPKSIHIV